MNALLERRNYRVTNNGNKRDGIPDTPTPWLALLGPESTKTDLVLPIDLLNSPIEFAFFRRAMTVVCISHSHISSRRSWITGKCSPEAGSMDDYCGLRCAPLRHITDVHIADVQGHELETFCRESTWRREKDTPGHMVASAWEALVLFFLALLFS